MMWYRVDIRQLLATITEMNSARGVLGRGFEQK
jgi:hypothetical protein